MRVLKVRRKVRELPVDELLSGDLEVRLPGQTIHQSCSSVRRGVPGEVMAKMVVGATTSDRLNP